MANSKQSVIGAVCLILVAVTVFVLVIVLSRSPASREKVDVNNPVRSAEKDRVTTLNGRKYPFKQYSGYLEATSEPPRSKFFHYYFVESQSDPSRDPLVLWLNGGPGCSSLFGLFTELGPIKLTPDGQITDNPHAWSRRANMIFLESPAGVGFSYSADGDMSADDDTTAAQNHRALQSFFEKFPEYKNRSLYLAGESYAGVYLPTLAVLVDQDPDMNLKGVAIGNGMLDFNKLAESFIFFSYHHGLIGQTTWDDLSTECCAGKQPTRGGCGFFDKDRFECQTLVNQVKAILLSGVNPYNLYQPCVRRSPKETLFGRREQISTGREQFDMSLMMHAFNVSRNKLDSPGVRRGVAFERPRKRPTCADDGPFNNFLNKPSIKSEMNIPEDLERQFTACTDEINYTMIYPLLDGGLAPQFKKLLASPRKPKLLVYNGDVDLVCNFLGDEWFVDDLEQKFSRPITVWDSWEVDDQIAGYVKHFEGITYMTVKGAGHMVPTDKPAEALAMFEAFVYGNKQQ